MTTLAIIGGGIAGHGLLYTLKKSGKKFDKILLFYSDSFASTCSLRSTAIVAPRGISAGVSPLGDLLHQSFLHFKQHVEDEKPAGVKKVTQYTGAVTKLEQFKKRYPEGEMKTEVGGINLFSPTYFALEEAFMIDPPVYLDWLGREAKLTLPVELINDFVVQIDPGEVHTLKTVNQASYFADHIVFAGGAANRYWRELSMDKSWQSSRPVQGVYLEFPQIDLSLDSFSLTLEGQNLIYDKSLRRLLVGSTTEDGFLEVTQLTKLTEIYQSLQTRLQIQLPPFENATVKIGLREKASKREPFFKHHANLSLLGGFYKNGFSLGLYLGKQWAKR